MGHEREGPDQEGLEEERIWGKNIRGQIREHLNSRVKGEDCILKQ